MLRGRASSALLSGLALLIIAGSLMATTAMAGPGPFAYHRPIGSKGNGVKITEQSPEAFQGEGGEQKAASRISNMTVEGVAKSVQIKGIIYNNNLQGQLKMNLKFNEVTLSQPKLPGCEVKIGKNDMATVVGHLAWKWNKTKAQLEEQSQASQGATGIGLGSELKEGATELPKSEFSKITFSGAACGVLVGTFTASGSETIKTKPEHLGEWSKSLAITLAEGKEPVHFWNGSSFIGGETGLMLGSEPATVVGESKAEVAQQEVTVLEN
jgi:hypothetical protein